MKQLTGLRLPVQLRAYAPDTHGLDGYDARRELISQVDVREIRPDVQLTVYSRGSHTPLGRLISLAHEGEALLRRLFGERDTPRVDRETFQQLMDELQEATIAGDTLKITLVRRQLHACLDAMAADLDRLGRLGHA